MKLYTNDGFSYDGMSELTVTNLRSELGKTTVFISEDDYLQLMAVK